MSHLIDDEPPGPLARPDHPAPVYQHHDLLLGPDPGAAEDEGPRLLGPHLDPLEAPHGLQEAVHLPVHDLADLLIPPLVVSFLLVNIKSESLLRRISVLINFS